MLGMSSAIPVRSKLLHMLLLYSLSRNDEQLLKKMTNRYSEFIRDHKTARAKSFGVCLSVRWLKLSTTIRGFSQSMIYLPSESGTKRRIKIRESSVPLAVNRCLLLALVASMSTLFLPLICVNCKALLESSHDQFVCLILNDSYQGFVLPQE